MYTYAKSTQWHYLQTFRDNIQESSTHQKVSIRKEEWNKIMLHKNEIMFLFIKKCDKGKIKTRDL